MKENYIFKNIELKKIYPHPDTFEYNRIPEMDGIKFERYNLKIIAECIIDETETEYIFDEEPEEFEINFSVPINSTFPLKTLFNAIEKTKESFKNDKYGYVYKCEYNEIEIKEVEIFIKNISDRTEFKINELYIIEEYKYVLYSTSKWINEIENECNFFNNIDDFMTELSPYLMYERKELINPDKEKELLREKEKRNKEELDLN